MELCLSRRRVGIFIIIFAPFVFGGRVVVRIVGSAGRASASGSGDPARNNRAAGLLVAGFCAARPGSKRCAGRSRAAIKRSERSGAGANTVIRNAAASRRTPAARAHGAIFFRSEYRRGHVHDDGERNHGRRVNEHRREHNT